jgi:xylulokinase
MSTYLGLDASTQGICALLIDAANGKVLVEETVNFGQDLPEYGCPQGFLDDPDPLVKHSDPLLWAAALDLVLARMRDSGVPLGQVAGISGSGQQHGTVYLGSEFATAMQGAESLAEAVRPCLTRLTSPIWMDSSTTAACGEIDTHCGGPDEVRRRTGSSAIERFSGPQIRKFAKTEPEDYAETAVIHLVSSYLCSLLIGGNAPIDLGDGAGMNLLNLASGQWDEHLLAATAPSLAEKLPRVVPSDRVVGELSPYFCQRYGFAAGTPVVAWSGDNPNSLIGVGGWQPGTAVISLGTSDTFFAAMQEPVVDPAGYGHVFGNPAGGFMCLICFKNGSLAREAVRDQFELRWTEFDVDSFRKTPAGNDGNMMLPYFVPEITPLVLSAGPRLRGDEAFVSGSNPAARVRALVEAQAMSMRLHSSWIGEDPGTVRVTGGAAKSDGICQVLADVFNATVERLETGSSAALGAAMRAAQGAGGYSWERLTERFCACVPGQSVAPVPANVAVYRDLMPRFAAFEGEVAG